MMGESTGLAKEATILNRKMTWTNRGITREADKRHAEEVVKAFHLEAASTVSTPGTDDKEDEGHKGRRHCGAGRRGWVQCRCRFGWH